MSNDLVTRLKARISDAGLDAADAMNEAIANIEALQADNARLRGLIDDVVCGRGMFGLSADDDLKWAMQHLGSALNTGKADT